MTRRLPIETVSAPALASALALVIIALAFAGCSRNNSTSTETAPDASPSKPANQQTPGTAFERDLQYVRNGQYTHIWIFARKDGHPLDKDDGAYLRTNAPQVVDWVTTDEGKKVIGGTNFDLASGNLGLLKKRFVVADYSGK